jgi:hypothetical protein
MFANGLHQCVDNDVLVRFCSYVEGIVVAFPQFCIGNLEIHVSILRILSHHQMQNMNNVYLILLLHCVLILTGMYVMQRQLIRDRLNESDKVILLLQLHCEKVSTIKYERTMDFHNVSRYQS